MSFLIANKEEFLTSGIEQFDFIVVSGDAYIDHPSFGVAVISRVLESRGFSVGIIPQPDWSSTESFMIYGEPKYAFMVSAGNIDSMVNHYSVSKNRRKQDLYSPNGEMGLRPDRATIVYGNKIREAYKDAQIVIGGIEASLRRLSHYDYWDNKVRRSILMDSSADLLIYGMAEHQIVEVAEAIASGIHAKDVSFVKGVVYKTKDIENVYDYIHLPNYNKVKSDKKAYNESFREQYINAEYGTAKTLVESYGNVHVVQTPPATPLNTNEFDGVYSLNYERNYHPMYESLGGIPAIREVKFSIISNRGCFGSCNFCALTFHQGRVVTARSHKSILKEANDMVWEPDFKGYIHDVGGPTANFRAPACSKQMKVGACSNKRCLDPVPCKQLNIDHKDYVELLRKVREIPKVKKVFIRSGIRYDYLIYDKDETFFNELCEHHISGQLKVAPEHVSEKVLHYMGKPTRDVYDRFTKKYKEINKKLNKEQYLVPYLMSSHPGSDLEASIELAEYLRDMGHMPEQVQDFYPTPGTLSTCIYYTEVDPMTNKKVYVPKTKQEKAMQRALIQYRLPQNYELVYKALKQAKRDDLIGFGETCLIRPRSYNNKKNNVGYQGKNDKNAKGGKSKIKEGSSNSNKPNNKGGYKKVTVNKNATRKNKGKGK